VNLSRWLEANLPDTKTNYSGEIGFQFDCSIVDYIPRGVGSGAHQIGHSERQRDVWLGVILAIAMSVMLAIGIQRIGLTLEGRAEAIFEGATMFLAVIVLTWMIYWMRYQARMIRSSLESDVQSAVETGNRRGLIAVAFIAVFREGVETALFLSAAAFAVEGGEILTGAILGLALAIAIGLALYASTIRLKMQWFFGVTSVLLLIFAAGLFAHGIHEFQEAGLLPSINPHIWDTNDILDENSGVGALLKSLVGYNGNPSLEEVVAYVAYWIFALKSIHVKM
jgi:high-affinity iron transporter